MFDVNLKIRGTQGDQSYSFILPDQSQQFVLNVVKTINIFLSEDDDKISNQNDSDLYSSFSKFAKIFPVENVKWVPPSNIFSQFGELINSTQSDPQPKTESQLKTEPEEFDHKDEDSDHFFEEPTDNEEMFSKHPKSEKVPTGRKQYGCEHCGKLFKQIGHLNAHVEEVHELDQSSKSHICAQCGKGYPSARKLNYHMTYTHSVKRKNESICKICGKTFSRAKLTTHMMQAHENNLPFVCHSCGKGFLFDCALKAHSLIHTGEKPFTCDQCGKGFKEKGTLERHKLSHESEKNHSCEICLKQFKFKHGLVRHKRLHTGEKPHMCTWCGQSFSQAANMQKHIRQQHTMEKSHVCKQCGKGFVQPYYLQRHMMDSHNADTFPPKRLMMDSHNADTLPPRSNNADTLPPQEPATNPHLQTSSHIQNPSNFHLKMIAARERT